MRFSGPSFGKTAALFALLAALSAPIFALDGPRAAAPGKAVAPLAWLVGGVWTADASKLGPGMKRIETRYQWSDNSAFLRFNTHFVMEKRTLKNYDGQFFWNPAQSSLEVWYTDAGNAITQGPVRIDGDTMEISFRGEDFEGHPADLRVLVVRVTNDRYTWDLAEKAGDGWKALASLTYERAGA